MERHQPLLVAVGVVFPAEGHAFTIEGNEPVIADRNAMRVASEITQHRFRASEGGLGVDYPVLAEQLVHAR